MKRVLPTGPAAFTLVERWRAADHDGKGKLAQEVGVSRGTLANFCSQFGSIEPEGQPSVLVPPIHTYEPVKGKNPETQVVCIGDVHDGEITPTYNHEVCKARFAELYKRVMTINHLHRNLYPVNDLVLFFLGDMVHGENPHQGAKVESISCGAMSQVYNYLLPELVGLILSFRQEFATVKIYAVPGNHGRISKEAPETSNWDTMLYHALAQKAWPVGIEIHVPKDFCQIVPIQGHRFFIFHGDQTRMSNGIPWFGLSRKVISWYITYGGFEYACCGHFHRDDLLRISAMTKLFVNGSFVSDDPFALKVMGTSSIPTQWTFGVHAKHGVTWSYALTLDEKYAPGLCPVSA
jgi:hypothetical protein